MRSVNTDKLARISGSQRIQEQSRILMPKLWQLLPKLGAPYHRSLTPVRHVRWKALSQNKRLKVPHSCFAFEGSQVQTWRSIILTFSVVSLGHSCQVLSTSSSNNHVSFDATQREIMKMSLYASKIKIKKVNNIISKTNLPLLTPLIMGPDAIIHTT